MKKCPLLKGNLPAGIRYDAAGNPVVLENIEKDVCLKEECMFYDEKKGQCSFLNITTGMSEQFEGFIEKIMLSLDELLFKRIEMLSVVISTSLKHLQDSSISYSEIHKKQLEEIKNILKASTNTNINTDKNTKTNEKDTNINISNSDEKLLTETADINNIIDDGPSNPDNK